MRTRNIKIRVTPEDADLLRQIAEEHDCSTSSLLDYLARVIPVEVAGRHGEKLSATTDLPHDQVSRAASAAAAMVRADSSMRGVIMRRLDEVRSDRGRRQ